MLQKTRHSTIQNIQYFFVCLFFASLNFEVFSPFVPNLSVAKMVALLYIGALLLTPQNMFDTKNIKHPLYCIFAMFLLMMISSIIHYDINSSIFNSTLFLNIIMFWLLLNHQRRDERVFQKGLIWFSISSFVVGLCFYFNIGVSIGEDMRIVVFEENANELGIKMVVGVLLLLNYCLNHSLAKSIYRPWLLLLAIPIVTLMFATASRTAFAVFASGVAVFVLFKQTKKKSTKILWFLVGFIAMIYGYTIFMQQDVLLSRIEKTIEQGSMSGRDDIWIKYIELVEKHPVLGVGFHGADSYAIEVFGEPKSPHNVLIETAVYSGILGLSCFLLFLYCFFRDTWLYRKKLYNCGPMTVSMTVIGMLMSGQAFGVKLFWVIAAYAISYRLTNIDTALYNNH